MAIFVKYLTSISIKLEIYAYYTMKCGKWVRFIMLNAAEQSEAYIKILVRSFFLEFEKLPKNV
ncbi:hypothetical protein CAL7716_042510 [Calothrix sp. PCC 7716]|nr:hypothetical protein CAL7716_042510 [Calothrix sp. PCC 7716]